MWSQKQISEERFVALDGRYLKFMEGIGDRDKQPTRVFEPLTPKQLEELDLIREVSRELQAKKIDDMAKAAQAKEEEKIAAEKEKEKSLEEKAPEGEGKASEEEEAPKAEEPKKEE